MTTTTLNNASDLWGLNRGDDATGESAASRYTRHYRAEQNATHSYRRMAIGV